MVLEDKTAWLSFHNDTSKVVPRGGAQLLAPTNDDETLWMHETRVAADEMKKVLENTM